MRQHHIIRSRGTDASLAALQCYRRFDLNQYYAEFEKRVIGYGGVLPPKWREVARGELQYFGINFKRFERFNNKIALFKQLMNGTYVILDEVRDELIKARDANPLITTKRATLILPGDENYNLDEDISSEDKTVHGYNVGLWAQRRIMEEIEARGYEIIEDTSNKKAFDFEFRLPGRKGTAQIMECKGTTKQKPEGYVTLSSNENHVYVHNSDRYWIGKVHDIQYDFKSQQASGGGTPIICDPSYMKEYAEYAERNKIFLPRLKEVVLESRDQVA